MNLQAQRYRDRALKVEQHTRFDFLCIAEVGPSENQKLQIEGLRTKSVSPILNIRNAVLGREVKLPIVSSMSAASNTQLTVNSEII